MFEKRKARLTRLAVEIEKRQASAAEGHDYQETALKPNRVNNAEFFSKIHAMQKKGGSGNVPLTG